MSLSNGHEEGTVRFAFLMLFIFVSETALSYTANKVWFEFRPRGWYRVYVNYTVPALKEFREAYVDFKDRKEAEQFYWGLVRGADFYPTAAKNFEFKTQVQAPAPW